MHPVTKCILGSNNERVSQLQEVLSIKGHLWAQSSLWIDPGSMDELPVDVILGDLVHLLLGG